MSFWKITLVALSLAAAAAGYVSYTHYGACACGDGCPCGGDCPCDH